MNTLSVVQEVNAVNDHPDVNPKALISRARRMARHHHLRLVKSRAKQSGGGYQLQAAVPVHGLGFELSIQKIVAILERT